MMMSASARTFALALTILGHAIASAADARATPFFSTCDNPPAQCLQRSRIPEQRDTQSEDCLRNPACAPGAPGTHAPGRRED
jgi:hypothetical protein